MKQFWRHGEQFVWATGAALSATLLMTFLLLVVVMYNGLGVFWPHGVALVELEDGGRWLGEYKEEETNPDNNVVQVQYNTGNRDLTSQDFQWFDRETIASVSYPDDAYVLERMEDGNFHGFLKEVKAPSVDERGEDVHARFDDALARTWEKYEEEVEPILDRTADLSNILQNLRFEVLELEYRKKKLLDRGGEGTLSALHEVERRLKEIARRIETVKADSDELVHEQTRREQALRENVVLVEAADGTPKEIPFLQIVRYTRPNAMSVPGKIYYYLVRVIELLTAEPRESNTEGGLFPAIFGTVMLIFLMAISSFPLGVIAGIYLREYAKEGVLVRLVRIAVNNLAGIPSIVYGIFGLGFFVYGIGGALDQLLYPERVAAGVTTFGTGGILWASLTLGLLTLPVVIVSTEEALGAIPMEIRQGSLALGATKFQTLMRVLLPMSSPGIMTGFILAMARAAGEVAPLMITGVVKHAPTLPLDGRYPFFHLDRKFMHLGFHIYDIGFQSPNVEAAKPMVYVTTLLLLVIVLVMSSVAIKLRNSMRKRYQIRGI